ncbi:microtubule-associated protein RP/EB family member 1 [Ditylenchus destructor]|nr:microtubule-associated protein RP/EB family member 1 [Ditylenchus destructor]
MCCPSDGFEKERPVATHAIECFAAALGSRLFVLVFIVAPIVLVYTFNTKKMPVVNVYSTSVTSENINRFELLAWVNDCLQSNLTKIEEMSTGAAYSQLTDMLFSKHIPLKKVKWNSRLEVDWLNNCRCLK